ncbi:MAG TPA: hypothetical protein VGD21_01580 [Lysobacter sp.]
MMRLLKPRSGDSVSAVTAQPFVKFAASDEDGAWVFSRTDSQQKTG